MQRLGQHFMIDRYALRAVADALEIVPGDTIVEIGPGKGALTDALRERVEKNKDGTRIIAIEKDTGFATALQKKYAATANIRIVTGDALRVLKDPRFLPPLSSYKITGNIPYYITGRLFRILTELRNPPQRAALTIQREVAERLVAQAPRTNLLGAIAQHAGRVAIIKNLKPGAFSPRPRVRSSILTLTGIKRYTDKDAAYYTFLRRAFLHPRKKLASNLLAQYSAPQLAAAFRTRGASMHARAHELSTETLFKLFETLQSSA